jgi:hypothetical protein
MTFMSVPKPLWHIKIKPAARTCNFKKYFKLFLGWWICIGNKEKGT